MLPAVLLHEGIYSSDAVWASGNGLMSVRELEGAFSIQEGSLQPA